MLVYAQLTSALALLARIVLRVASRFRLHLYPAPCVQERMRLLHKSSTHRIQ
jgi:hypothetical protein